MFILRMDLEPEGLRAKGGHFGVLLRGWACCLRFSVVFCAAGFVNCVQAVLLV